jgi:hypothetical protein
VKPSRASRVFAVIACVAAAFVLTALFLDFSSAFLNYFDIGVGGGERFFFPMFFYCPIVLALLLVGGLSVFFVLRKRSRGPWLSFVFALVAMFILFSSSAAFEVYRFRDYPGYPPYVRGRVSQFVWWYVTSFKFPWRPNQALQPTTGRRVVSL